MALNINAFISQGDILLIKALKQGKVYKLFGFHDDSLIVKWEAGDEKRLKEVSSMVGSIDSMAKPVLLEGFERMELMSWCKDKVEWIKRQQVLQNDSSHEKELFKAADDVAFLLGQKAVPCVKMATLKVITLQDAIDDFGTSKQPLKSIIKTLVDPNGLEQLGRVVAVDLIAGNADRFSPENKYPTKVKLSTREITLQTVVNLGNVMIATSGSLYGVSALDTFDPFSTWHRVGGNSITSQENQDVVWPGRYLTVKSLRRRYSEQIISDLEALFLPARKGLFSALGRNASDRLQWGMVEGGLAAVGAIKSYIKSNKGSLSPSRQQIIVELNKLTH